LKDSVVESVIEDYKVRSEKGFEKYGTTLERTDIDILGWLKHLREELMDATLYIKKLENELGEKRL
jgi:hypothetical protein